MIGLMKVSRSKGAGSVHTKQRVLPEALRLFSQRGHDAVSVEQIADAVGVKAPSLYKHYKSKQDIFDLPSLL